jgi:heme-degrading monooxygenase HmoA
LTGENIYGSIAPVKAVILVTGDWRLELSMIARTWRGATKAQDGEAYLEYLHRTGFAEYRKTPGNRGVLGLRRIVNDRAEFLLVSLWESEEAIRQFAGSDIDKAVFYPEDERFLVDRDNHVSHYEVVFDTAAITQD